MFKKVSILHISDIHKKEGDNFKSLFSSMVKDCNNYMYEGIMKPNVIVVSGDLIRGGSTAEIKKQYQEALDFLEDLTNFFLDGDKSRIVIVPGNHDVDWNVSQSVMEDLPNTTEKEKELYKKAFDLFQKDKAADNYRWNWDKLILQKYEKEDVYNERFKQFAEFYHSFYQNRAYSLVPTEQYDIFDMSDIGLCFVGFNSCYLNDHLNKAGQICPVCVTTAADELKQNQGNVMIAVWHHNTSGRPRVTNYLDTRIFPTIIDMGVHIALHGHQHYSGVVEEYRNAYKGGKLVIYSTGSLYGAEEQLSYGAPRQYSIIEMEQEAGDIKVTVHLRADDNDEEYEIPEWKAGKIKGLSESKWTTHIPLPQQPLDDEKLSELMQKGMQTGDYGEVIKLLEEINPKDERTRLMLLDFKVKNRSYMEVLDDIGNPKTKEECLLLIKMAQQANDEAIYKTVRELEGIKHSEDASIRKMRDYLYKD